MRVLILRERFRNRFRALTGLELSLAFSFGTVSGIMAGRGRSLATEATLLLPIAFELFSPTVVARKMCSCVPTVLDDSIGSLYILCLIAAGIVMQSAEHPICVLCRLTEGTLDFSQMIGWAMMRWRDG